jgi:hypothetical protein
VTRRLVAAFLVAVSALLWLGVAAPARRERDAAREEYARLRAERERVRARLAELERRAGVGRSPESGTAAALALRRALLRATELEGVEDVRIAASAAGRGQVAATGQLSLEGPLETMLAVSDRLAEPGSGVLVRRATLAQLGAEGPQVRLDVEGASARSGP